jgi:hypothetical protein
VEPQVQEKITVVELEVVEQVVLGWELLLQLPVFL